MRITALLFSAIITVTECNYISENATGCPLWRSSNASTTAISKAVKCTQDEYGNYQLSLLPCYCVTQYHHNSSVAVAGFCPYTCNATKIPLLNYITLNTTTNATVLTESLCKQFSRTGQMCGECEKGYAPAVYSYSVNCVNCTNYKFNWLKYIAVAFGPQTLFFTICVFTKLSVTSGSMIGYVTVSQLLATTIELRFKATEISSEYNIVLKILLTIYGLWNLDFFRIVYTPFCLSQETSMLTVIALDYVVALYPMVLIAATYAILSLYDKYKTIFRFSALFHQLIHRYYQTFNIRNSMVDAFATMLLLSYVKILNTSIQLLLSIHLFDQDGGLHGRVVYYSGGLKSFGADHLPYVLLAVSMLLAFNISPIIILTIYPCKCSQKWLCCCNGACFHNIMDDFHRDYKVFPKDRRYFAVVYLYLRAINIGLLFISLSPLYISLVSILYLTMAVAIGTIQPYKVHLHNLINAALFYVIAVLKILEVTIDYLLPIYFDTAYVKAYVGIEAMLFFIPPLYGLLLLTLRIIPKKLLTFIKLKLRAIAAKLKSREASIYEESFPHRISHVDEYTHLTNVST